MSPSEADGNLASEDSIPTSVFNIAFFDDAADADGDEDEKEKVEEWLKGLGLGRYIPLLREEGFDHFSIIRDLDDDNIDQLVALCKMPRLHARQFRLGLERLVAEGPGVGSDWVSRIDSTFAPEVDCNTSVDGADEAGGIGPTTAADATVVGDTKVENAESLRREDEQEQSPKDEKPVRQKKTNITLHNKCTKTVEKNKRKRANKKAAREQEWHSLIEDLRA